MSKALRDADTSHKEFALVSNEANNYCRLKENIKIRNSERNDTERYILIEQGQWIGLDEIMKQNKKLIIM